MTVKTSRSIFTFVVVIFTVIVVLSFLYESFDPLVRWACYLVILATLNKALAKRRANRELARTSGEFPR